MKSRFEIRSAVGGRFLFNLKAGNGEIILTSGLFPTKEAAAEAAAMVQANAPNEAAYERRVAADERPYFVVKTPDGDVLGRSETYSSTSAMEKGIRSVRRNAASAVVKEFVEAEAELEPAHS